MIQEKSATSSRRRFLLGILVQPEEQDVILTIHVQDLAEFNISI